MLYFSNTEIWDRNKAAVNDSVQLHLLAEATIVRDNSYSRVITRKLRDAAKILKEHESKNIRNADKANCFVGMIREEH